MMSRKWFAQLAVAPCAFALAFGLSACSDDSSGTNAHIDTGDEISFDIPTGNSSGSNKSPSSSESRSSDLSDFDESWFNEGWRKDCLDKINEYRATENLLPLSLASEEKLACTDKQAAADLASNKAHGHIGDCGEFAQNSGPNFSTSWQTSATSVSDYYLKMMWEDEKELVLSGKRDPDKKEDYPYIGHYLNMKNKNATEVACGIALSADGEKGWFNVNFF